MVDDKLFIIKKVKKVTHCLSTRTHEVKERTPLYCYSVIMVVKFLALRIEIVKGTLNKLPPSCFFIEFAQGNKAWVFPATHSRLQKMFFVTSTHSSDNRTLLCQTCWSSRVSSRL